MAYGILIFSLSQKQQTISARNGIFTMKQDGRKAYDLEFVVLCVCVIKISSSGAIFRG